MMNKDFERELFDEELKILEAARLPLHDESYRHNGLLPQYTDLVRNYDKLLKLTRKIFKISDLQGKALKKRESEIKNLLDHANQGFLTFGRDLTINKEYSAECVRIFSQKVASLNIADLLAGPDDHRRQEYRRIFSRIFTAEGPEERQGLLQQLPRMIQTDGKYINVEYKLLEPPDDEDNSDETVLMLISTDITEKRLAEDQIKYLSYYDKLTGLSNRAHVDSILGELEFPENRPLSIIVADMNGLKLINDVFGHARGDCFLADFAGILARCCRKTDVVARWGGDEFLILLPRADRPACERVCAKIRAACAAVAPNPIGISAALGWATGDSPRNSFNELFSLAESRMYADKLLNSKEVRRNIILNMENALQERCFESAGHTERVKGLAVRFAMMLGIGRQSAQMENLVNLAALHDIGKIAIPGEILAKKGKLTPAEWEIMKTHVDIGYRMAQSIRETALADAMLAMRERWDGTGYPNGLRENQIPLFSRMIAIIEVYDLLLHGRPYRKAMARADALAELKRCAGSQFDPYLVERFAEMMAETSDS